MAKTVKFVTPEAHSFHYVVEERVKKYFTDSGIAMTGNKLLYQKTRILFTCFACAYLGILSSSALLSNSPPGFIFIWIMLLYGFLGLVIPGLGFNVMHDAVHGSYSENDKLNRRLAFWSGDVMGASTFIWWLKHNILHHTFTNIDNHDDDITKHPLFRMHPHQKWLPHHAYQRIYAPIFYCFLSIHWSLVNDYKRMLFDKKILNRELRPKRKDYIRFFVGKAINLSIFILPAFILPHWWYALVGFVFMHAVTGYTLAIVFQMAHVVEGPEFVDDPIDGQKIQTSWKEHQLRTTANFDPESAFLTWYVGGLNYQIEHHLFPYISHVHYPAISKIVQRTAQEFNLPYNVFAKFRLARRSHFRIIALMGKRPQTAHAV